MDDKFIDKFKIDSTRLIGWDYSNSGTYFITTCTYLHNNFFGKIENGKMVLSTCGEITKNELLKTFEIRKNLELYAWVVMPNHVHVLFSVRDFNVDPRSPNGETHCNASLLGDPKPTEVISNYRNHPDFFEKINIKSNKIVPRTIKLFKGAVTRECKNNRIFFAWQTRFYDEVITDENKLKIVKYYIKNNPNNWEKDKFYN